MDSSRTGEGAPNVTRTFLLTDIEGSTRQWEESPEMNDLVEQHFDVLRRARAELRSPTRLSSEATRIGMHPAATSQFVPVDGLTVALAIAAAGEVLDDSEAIASLQPLDQFRLVKAVSGEAP